jgi:ATP-dependent DNA ligase
MRPMLGRLTRELPLGDFVYEPKWDGFRCLACRSGTEVDLRSRHGRPLARYFPELVTALTALSASRFVLDGEILIPRGDGYDFAALMARLHPAQSRVRALSERAPATLVLFDVLELAGVDLRERPFAQRRAALEGLVPTDHVRPGGGRELADRQRRGRRRRHGQAS